MYKMGQSQLLLLMKKIFWSKKDTPEDWLRLILQWHQSSSFLVDPWGHGAGKENRLCSELLPGFIRRGGRGEDAG